MYIYMYIYIIYVVVIYYITTTTQYHNQIPAAIDCVTKLNTTVCAYACS